MGSGYVGTAGFWHRGPAARVSQFYYSSSRNGGERDPWVQLSFSVTSTIVAGSFGFWVWFNPTTNGYSNVVCKQSMNTTYETSYTAYNDNTSGEAITNFILICNGNTPMGYRNNCTAKGPITAAYGPLAEGASNYSPYNVNITKTISVPAYVSDTPPTNITGGRVYNQNGVVNGDDKPDWDFYVDWWGESAGTHTISHYNLDIYNAANLNRRVAVVENVKKFTRYNFESLLPKCKVGETYAFYVDALIDNSYWLGKVYIGSIKLYKDGIVWVKNYSNGSKVEATMAYNKYYTNGSKKKSRYILVKDISGAKRIIDMYTTHYE